MNAVRPTVRLLSDLDAQQIVSEACRCLETTGVLVENALASKLLAEAGAREEGDRFKIPEKLARDSVASAPRRVAVHDRGGRLALDLGEDRVHFDPGSAAIHVLDSQTGRRRDATTRDVADLARLVDGLGNYAAQSTALSPSDVPLQIADRTRLYLALTHGRKPVVTGTFQKDGFGPMHAMLSAVRGSEAALAQRPLAIFDCCPSPPLKWSDLTCQALIDCARAGVPAELVSMPLTGATSPVTLRGAIVQHAAENLSGIVIHQLARKGAPIIYGGSPAAFDMRHGTTPMGAVETMMIDVGYAQVGKHLGLPTHAYMALSDAKCVDYQAGFETAMGAVLAVLAGVNMISGPGMLDFESTQSLEKLLLDNEVCGMALRLVRGIERREGDEAALIDELVRKGEFLSHPHTRKNWRAELGVPSPLVDRQTYGDWETSGALSADRRAADELERRLGTAACEPLPPDIQRALDEIMQAELQRVGLKSLPG
ncbi:MAG: trimethylamine methyltransferase family protein [Deltaproteobacteria bacterium]|nr:trimethylamine methyltransferase family protein [Deltaproteobacteria bacterium]